MGCWALSGIADLTPEPIRGAAYGLRQSLDTVGAFLGPVLAMALMLHWAGDFRKVFWFAVIPGALAVALLLAGVREPEASKRPGEARSPIRWGMLKLFDKAYWWVVAVGAVLALLVLRVRLIPEGQPK